MKTGIKFKRTLGTLAVIAAMVGLLGGLRHHEFGKAANPGSHGPRDSRLPRKV